MPVASFIPTLNSEEPKIFSLNDDTPCLGRPIFSQAGFITSRQALSSVTLGVDAERIITIINPFVQSLMANAFDS